MDSNIFEHYDESGMLAEEQIDHIKNTTSQIDSNDSRSSGKDEIQSVCDSELSSYESQSENSNANGYNPISFSDSGGEINIDESVCDDEVLKLKEIMFYLVTREDF